MLRKLWLAVCGTILTGGLAWAQPPGPANPMPMPYGNPGGYGYPGYPTPSYGPPMGPGPGGPMPPGAGVPMPPWGNPGAMPFNPMPQPAPFIGAMPMMPGYGNGLPMTIPPDPRRPVPPPNFDGAGPKQGASEPYMVGPGAPSAKGSVMKLPPAPVETQTAAPVVADSYVDPASYGVPMPPSEPYTLYEGPRYLAEVKQDNVHVFGQVTFVHFWTQRDVTPPLLTTGSPTSLNPGTLGNADTRTLLGGGAVDPNEFSGVQANIGLWLDPERLNSIEVGGFFVGNNSRGYSFTSNAAGSPIIAQPAVLPGPKGFAESAFTISAPGFLAGGASVTSVMNFMGAELNFGRNLFRYNGWSLDALAGFRYMYLNDTLDSTQSSTVLPGGANAISYLGVPQPAGANFLLNDSFNMTNRFYGGQIGARLDWVSPCLFDFGAVIKVAFGDTVHTGIVDGNTTLTNGGVSTTAPGGAYALPSDIGMHQSGDFTVATELNLTIGYQIHPNIRLIAGYTLLYWPNVERAGEQIDRTQSSGQSATDPAYNGSTGTSPRFLNTRSDFWAQGLNLGVELKY